MKILTLSCLLVVLLVASTTAEPGLLGNLVGSVTNLVTTTVNTVISLLTSLIFTLDILTPTQTATSSVEIATTSGVILNPTQLNITASVLVQFQAKINALANVDPTSVEVTSLNTTIVQLVAKLKLDLQATGLSATNAGKIGLGVQTYLFNFLSTFLKKLNEQFVVVTNLISSASVSNAASVSAAIVTDVLGTVSGKFSRHVGFLLNRVVDHANLVISVDGELSLELNADQQASLNTSVQAAVENSATTITNILFDVSSIPQDVLNRVATIYSGGITRLLRRTICVALRVVRNLITKVLSVVNSLLTTITSVLLGQVRDTVTTIINPLLENVTSTVSATLLADGDVLIARLKVVVENINDVDDFLPAFKKLWQNHCYKTRLNILRTVYDQLVGQVTIIRPTLLGLISLDVLGTLDGEISNVVGTVGSLLDNTLSNVFIQLTGDLSVTIDGIKNDQALLSVSAQVTTELSNLESNFENIVNSLDVKDEVKEKLISILKEQLETVKDQIDHSQTPDNIVTAGVILDHIISGLKDSTEEIDSSDDTLRVRYIGLTIRNILNRVLNLLNNLTDKQVNLLTTLVENVISKANIEAQAAISLLNVANGKNVNDVVVKVITNAVATLNVGLTNIKATGSLTLVQQQVFTTVSSQVLLVVQAELNTRSVISIVANLLNTVVNVVKTVVSGNPKVYSLDVLNPSQIVDAVKEVVTTVGNVATDVEARLIANIIVDVQAKVNFVIANGDVSATVTANLAAVIASSKTLITQTLQTVGNTLLNAQKVATAVTTYVQNLVNTVVNNIKTDQQNSNTEGNSDSIQQIITDLTEAALAVHVTLNEQLALDINVTLSEAVVNIESELTTHPNLTSIVASIDAIIQPINQTVADLIQSVTDIIIKNNGADDILNSIPILYGNCVGDLARNAISGITKVIRLLLSDISNIVNNKCASDNFVLVRGIVDIAISNATTDVAAILHEIINDDVVNFHNVYGNIVADASDVKDLVDKLQKFLANAHYNLKRHVLNGIKNILKRRVKIVHDLISNIVPNSVLIDIETTIQIAVGDFVSGLNNQFVDTLIQDLAAVLEKIKSASTTVTDDDTLHTQVSAEVDVALNSVANIVAQANIDASVVSRVVTIIKDHIKACGDKLIFQSSSGDTPNTPLKLAVFINRLEFDALAEATPNHEFLYIQFILNELRSRVSTNLTSLGVSLTADEKLALSLVISNNIDIANSNCASAIANAGLDAAANVNLYVYQSLDTVIAQIKTEIKASVDFRANVQDVIFVKLDELLRLAQFDLGRVTVQIKLN